MHHAEYRSHVRRPISQRCIIEYLLKRPMTTHKKVPYRGICSHIKVALKVETMFLVTPEKILKMYPLSIFDWFKCKILEYFSKYSIKIEENFTSRRTPSIGNASGLRNCHLESPYLLHSQFKEGRERFVAKKIITFEKFMTRGLEMTIIDSHNNKWISSIQI